MRDVNNPLDLSDSGFIEFLSFRKQFVREIVDDIPKKYKIERKVAYTIKRMPPGVSVQVLKLVAINLFIITFIYSFLSIYIFLSQLFVSYIILSTFKCHTMIFTRAFSLHKTGHNHWRR